MLPRKAIGWAMYGMGGFCLIAGLLGHAGAFAPTVTCFCAGTAYMSGTERKGR